MNRTLDLSADRHWAVEIAREENRLEQRGNLVTVVTQHRTKFLLKFGSQFLANKEPIDFPRDEARRDRLFEDDVDHIHAIQVSGTAEKCLRTVVVLLLMNNEL